MLATCNEAQQNHILMFVTHRDIEALVDNELSSSEEKRVFEGMQKSPALRNQYNTLKAQKEALQNWWSEMGRIQN